ncbi:PucR family transcriptional regulator [Streptomyces fractus]|uniref:PucR family transcriptional regulator n=1 Tax=Streptomyces fractus TaxID=641806 RepID=UPI003CEA6149
MSVLTLREILHHFDAAAPEVLAGGESLDHPVRWTHSSEVYEGASFLDGGELLLTNGFGLLGASAADRRRYVREVAARGAAGLAVEVGRALAVMPDEVVDEARGLGLPLIALRRVVPFVRLTEAANRAIVTRGLTARTVPAGDDHAAGLLADLADGRPVRPCEVTARAALAGFRPGEADRLVAVAVHGPAAVLDRAAREAGSTGVLRAAFPGDALGVLALRGTGDPVGRVQDALREAGGAQPFVAAVGPAVSAVGHHSRWGETVRAARECLDLALTVPPAEVADGEGPLITSCRALALERELTRGDLEAGRERLTRLAEDALGPLLAWEAAHSSDLVRTLEVYLRNGCSPTRAAALLHIGRQSLYQRVERIESLLGIAVGDPGLLGALLTATCAHRLVRARAPHTAESGRFAVAV